MPKKATAELTAIHAALRCGAKTRIGRPCRSPAVAGNGRCRMHGGADGSGAPLGNKNALKHGRFTRKAIEERKLVRLMKKQAKAFFKRAGSRI